MVGLKGKGGKKTLRLFQFTGKCLKCGGFCGETMCSQVGGKSRQVGAEWKKGLPCEQLPLGI